MTNAVFSHPLRAISLNWRLFLKRPSLSSTVGTILWIRSQCLRSGGLCGSSSSCAFVRGTSFGATSVLRWWGLRRKLWSVSDPAACSSISWWEKLPLSGVCFVFVPLSQFSRVLLFQKRECSRSFKENMSSLLAWFVSALLELVDLSWRRALFSLRQY